MRRINLPKTPARIVIDDQPLFFMNYVGENLLNVVDEQGNQFLIEDVETGTKRMPDLAFIEQLIVEERFRISRLAGPIDFRSPAPVEPHVIGFRTNLDPDEIASRDPKARKRLFTVRALRKLNCVESDPVIGKLLKQVYTPEAVAEHGEAPSPKTVRRWLRRVRGLQVVTLADMMNVTGLVPRAPSAKRLDPAMREIVHEAARHYYLAGEGFRLRDAEARVNEGRKAENARRKEEGGVEPQLGQPSRETIRRAILAIRCKETLQEKFGEAWVKRRFKVAGLGITTQRALQLAFIDDKVLDLITVLDDDGVTPIGQPWVCFIVDLHTRCILGWWIDFSAPTVHTATECFKHACRPKAVPDDRLARWPILRQIYGLVSELVCDNGSNYASPAWEDALADVGTTLRMAAVRTPTHKNVMERVFRTLDTMLVAKLPGYASPELAEELGIDRAKHAILTMSELRELIETFVYVYHITNHSGVQMPPAKKFDLATANLPVNVLENPRRLDQFMGDTFRVRVTKNGFQVKGHWWRETEPIARILDVYAGIEKAGDRLKNTASAWVKARINRGNLAEAHLWDPEAKDYVTVGSATPHYSTALSLHAHEQIQAWAKKQGLEFSSEEDRLEARHALNERVRELIPDVAMRDRRAMARMLGSKLVQERQEIEVGTVEPRHDGLSRFSEVSAAADEREDGHTLPGRPARRTPPAPKAETPLESTLEDGIRDSDGDWEAADDGPGADDDANPETDPDSDWEDK